MHDLNIGCLEDAPIFARSPRRHLGTPAVRIRIIVRNLERIAGLRSSAAEGMPPAWRHAVEGEGVCVGL